MPALDFPYSDVRRAGNLLFVSGQLPIDPDGQFHQGRIEDQTRLTIANLKALLEREGSSLTNVVKVMTWLSDGKHVAGYNAVYSELFAKPYPARSTVVTTLVVPADIEIEAVAIIPE